MPAIEFETVSRNGAVSTPARYSDWDMQYPLTERIGNPELLAGREKEFRLINKWLSKIPERMSKSRVIPPAARAERPHLSREYSIACGAKTAR